MLYAEYEYLNFAYYGKLNLCDKDPQHPNPSFQYVRRLPPHPLPQGVKGKDGIGFCSG